VTLRDSSRLFDFAKRSGLRLEPRRPLFLAATNHVVLQSADAAADPVEHHAPAALPILKSTESATPRASTPDNPGTGHWMPGAFPQNCNNAPACQGVSCVIFETGTYIDASRVGYRTELDW
jgi:hypothetical protein